MQNGMKVENIHNCSTSQAYDLVVAPWGTTRGLWFQGQVQSGAINHNDAPLSASQTEALNSVLGR